MYGAMWSMCTICVLILANTESVFGDAKVQWNAINLPEEHLPYFFNNNPEIKKKCLQDDDCPFKEATSITGQCWGYEEDCPQDNMMSYPECPTKAQSLKAWLERYGAKSQEEVFWRQADFGFGKERLKELKSYCTPQSKGDSSLKCADHMRYCKGENIYMDFRKYKFDTNDRYSEHVFKIGDIGGKCSVHRDKLASQGEHKSPLQSWYAEMQHFTSLDFNPTSKKHCDLIVEKPTIVMKLDAGVNMYHHFCDYLNLYLSQHMNNSFRTDINIINWDTSYMKYGDFFSKTWDVFTDHQMAYLKEYAGKRVCFKDIMFPLLARMRYGLYYNTPLISGCQNTALFRSFQQHVLHRLGVRQEGPLKNKIRITLLSRGTKYRKILNQDEVYDALVSNDEYEVLMVNYNHTVPFEEQLRMSMNSDIFMGMHGSGLSHLLFQPDWGAIFEIFNCGDPNCYKDLARLRGVKYYTWENEKYLIQEDEGHHPTLGAHQKFTNYSFDVDEFKRIVANMVTYVKHHPSFRVARRNKYGGSKSNEDRNEL